MFVEWVSHWYQHVQKIERCRYFGLLQCNPTRYWYPDVAFSLA
jgi:hypothetical protein